MSKTKKEFVLRPEDRAFSILMAATALIKQMLETGVRVSVVISRWSPKKTPAQHRTVFMWNGEVAAELTARGALLGNPVFWKTDDVHEFIFKRLCMPLIERTLPDGEIVGRPMGLSDPEATLEIVSEAMERYQVWAIEHGIELTQPIDDQYSGFR